MIHDSCIQHPPRNPTVVLRADYLRLCDGDHCAAMILSQHEHWHNVKLDHLPHAGELNKAAVRAAEESTQDVELWVYQNQTGMKSQLMGLFGDKAMTAGYQKLVAKGFLAKRTNPKYTWDRTLQYLFSVEAVQAAVDALPLLPDEDEAVHNKDETAQNDQGAELRGSKAQNCGMENAEMRDAERKNAESKPQECAIPNTSPETSPETSDSKTTRTRTPAPVAAEASQEFVVSDGRDLKEPFETPKTRKAGEANHEGEVHPQQPPPGSICGLQEAPPEGPGQELPTAAPSGQMQPARGCPAKLAPKDAEPTVPTPEDREALRAALTGEGLAAGEAKTAAYENYEQAAIQLENLHHALLDEIKCTRGAWLHCALRDSYGPTKGYQRFLDKQKVRANETARRATQAAWREVRVAQEAEAEARKEREDAQVEAFLNAAGADDLAVLAAEAREIRPQFMRGDYDKSPDRKAKFLRKAVRVRLGLSVPEAAISSGAAPAASAP